MLHLVQAYGLVPQSPLRDEGGHGVDDHDVHRAGAHQHVGDVERLFAVVGLGDEQFVGLHAEAGRIGDVERVFGVDEGGHTAHALTFGDDVQGEGGLAGGFGAVYLGNAAARNAADTEGQVKGQGAGGDGADVHGAVLA